MCDSCAATRINGVLCHEHGCPDAWKDKVLECAWCGSNFKPDEGSQNCCSESCEAAYYGLPELEEIDY